MKYQPSPQISMPHRMWPNRVITKAPTWCSVDLRDGNQALPDPMGIETKLKFFTLLCQIGFKEIEIGFPSANDTEFSFCRRLIEENLIPEDVTIQVLVQSKPELIDRTFAALKGARKAIVHLYNSTNPAQREIVFNKDKAEIIDLACTGTKHIVALAHKNPETDWTFQYSPESFSQTELAFASEICNYVAGEWINFQPNKNKVIINLPATVEVSTPNVYADQIEWMKENLDFPELTILSLHTHNDRGTGVAATELGLLAGAIRVEGTLFGNGERTGNADIVTLALNLLTQGISPELDLANLPGIADAYCEMTGMTIHDRHPYAGSLVLTAFSGSHQDAISKGLTVQKKDQPWQVPYLPIDPKDIGREYEKVIRINSQSGKGGINHILKERLGLTIPKAFQTEIGSFFKKFADQQGVELSEDEIVQAFLTQFVNRNSPYKLVNYDTTKMEGYLGLEARFQREDQPDPNQIWVKSGVGNGPLDALTDLFNSWKEKIQIKHFEEYSAKEGSEAKATAFILLEDGRMGIGIDPNIETAALNALICAINLQK